MNLNEKLAAIGCKLSNKTYADSFVLNLKFWETKYPEIYITDYDPSPKLDFYVNRDLKIKNTLALFHKSGSYIYFSADKINDPKEMDGLFNFFIENSGMAYEQYDDGTYTRIK